MRHRPVLGSLLALGLTAAQAAAAQSRAASGAAPRTARGGAAGPLAAALMQREREYMRVGLTRDTAALVRLSAMDATIINPDGSVVSGAQQVRDVASGAMVFESASPDSMQVRTLGSDAAVVSGIGTVRGHVTLPGGQPQDISGRYRFIDVWQRIGGRWQVVAESATRIAG